MVSTQPQIVRESTPGDLRLPNAPGVIRAFWARHPKLADWLLVIAALVFAGPTFILSLPDEPTEPLIGLFALALQVAAAIALLWRRAYPLTVFIIGASPLVILDPPNAGAAVGIAPLIAIYSIAVYRSNRAALWTIVIAVSAHALTATLWWLIGPTPISDAVASVIGLILILLFGALVGTNVGSRKRYVEALIERSKQLAIERDQQAKLAAAAERSRIAREMHDIVSHSLAVVVTLAEGARATSDVARAREANEAIANTARDALEQMRGMLGVLRDESDTAAPLTPQQTTIDDLVDNAKRAGVPVRLTITGTPTGPEMQRLAIRRIVQESLTNVMRYAPHATSVAVTIDHGDDRVLVTVENDAAQPQTSLGSGLGLRGLAERVTALGGTFTAGQVGQDHWRVSAEFPRESHI